MTEDCAACDEADEFAKYRTLLPEGSTPLHGISLVKYLDAEGETAVNWHVDGKPTREMAAGMLEMAKFDILRSFLANVVAAAEDDD